MNTSPAKNLAPDWRCKPKTWGHPFQNLCPYPGLLPARLPHYFIQKFTHKGDVVLDPFCGSGAVPLQACVEGRIGIGLDPSPLAYALSRSKVTFPDPVALQNRLDDLSNDMFFDEPKYAPPALHHIYHPDTLRQIVFLREQLNPEEDTDALLQAVILGMLHGGTQLQDPEKSCRYLSAALPAKKAIAPTQVEDYVKERGLQAPHKDVFLCLRRRLDQLMRSGYPQRQGQVWKAPVQDISALPEPNLKRKKAQLILTEPPGLGNPDYGRRDWIRLWFLKEDPAFIRNILDNPRRLDHYLAFMQDVCRLLYKVAAPGGILALVIKDARKRGEEPIPLAREVWKHLARKRSKWELADLLEDTDSETPGVEAATGRERILVLFKEHYAEREDPVYW